MLINPYYVKKIYRWLLPYICILCGHPSSREQDLCAACLNDLPKIKTGCKRCAVPLPAAATLLTCGHCLQKPPPFDAAHILYLYEPPVTRLILELKFRQALVHARILGELLAWQIQQYGYKTTPLPDMIIPIPLHAERLKERGFNQALEIARPMSKILELPIRTDLCQRNKLTAPQATLPAGQRRQNVKQAFAVSGRLDQRHIAVVDDVITTGNTITEFCQALKNHGAAKVDVWCCARTGLAKAFE
jgi:ComF family protein